MLVREFLLSYFYDISAQKMFLLVTTYFSMCFCPAIMRVPLATSFQGSDQHRTFLEVSAEATSFCPTVSALHVHTSLLPGNYLYAAAS